MLVYHSYDHDTEESKKSISKIHKRYTSIITVTHFIIDIEHESSTNLEDWFYSYQDALFGRQFYFKYRTS